MLMWMVLLRWRDPKRSRHCKYPEQDFAHQVKKLMALP
jgi:hypothetical protein